MQQAHGIYALDPFLADHPFFKSLDPSYQELLVECATNVRVAEGHYLFHEGEPAGHLYLIRSGKIAVRFTAPGHEPVTIQTLGRGDILGWSWLVPPYRWHFDAFALETTQAIAVNATCLKRKCENDPRLGYELTQQIAQLLAARLQAARLQIIEAREECKQP